MEHPLVVKLNRDAGAATVVYHPDKQRSAADDLAVAIGKTTVDRRGAYVYPLGRVKRRIFKVLRRWFGGAGIVAGWTRRWRGPWVVVLPGEHVRLPGTFKTHAVAVEAEVAWILRRS